MRGTERMTETSEGREPSLREVSATDSADSIWAASIAPDALLAAGGDILERLYRTNRALFEFWRGRIEYLGDATQRIAACRSIEDVQQIQGRYAQDMLRAYAAMWSKLPGLLFTGAAGSEPCEGARRIDARRLILAALAMGANMLPMPFRDRSEAGRVPRRTTGRLCRQTGCAGAGLAAWRRARRPRSGPRLGRAARPVRGTRRPRRSGSAGT